jgi:hypothetical protein
MYEILINILIFGGILVLLALTIAIIMGVFILNDVRRISKEVREKVLIVTSVFDIVSLVLGGMEGAKKKFKKKLKNDDSTLLAFLAGIKKSVQVLLKK